MDEKFDNLMRSIVAQQAAHAFVLDYVLKQIFLELPLKTRLSLAETLLNSSTQTEWLNGVSKDDFQAERLADMVVRMQQYVDQMIGRALEATEWVEAHRSKPT